MDEFQCKQYLSVLYIIHKLFKNKTFFILTDKIPQEIPNWYPEERGEQCVYNGRGMVIGCAQAGKSTLVKKLKAEKDVNTKSKSRIGVHSHPFKLNENESTITGKHFLL